MAILTSDITCCTLIHLPYPPPPPRQVLELCIILGLSIIVWAVNHHYHHPT